MTLTRFAIFDDSRGQWGPLTELRPLLDVRTGMLTTRQRIARILAREPDALLVTQPLAAITRITYASTHVNSLPDDASPDDRWLLVHGAAALPETINRIRQLQPGHALCDAQGHLAGANITTAQLRQWMQNTPAAMPPETICDEASPVTLLDRPWDIQRHLEAMLVHDLAVCDLPQLPPGRPGIAIAGEHAIKIAPDAKIHPMVVINAEKGPVVIDHQAIVGSFSVIAGPCYIGRKTIITPQTHIRANCSIGPGCVIGGEVSATVIQGYTNKCHAGYLGNAIVGQWVNLGADTNVSNLKNTFGQVRMQLSAESPAENTGLPKLGPLIGDFARTAIGSRLMTGSCIGTGAMVALSGFAPKFIPRFAFLTDEEAQQYDIEKFIASAAHMMSRREVQMSDAMQTRLRLLATPSTIA